MRVKETYLLFLIVIGLVSLSIYSTYALFTEEYVVGSVNLNASNYIFNLDKVTEYKRIDTYANRNRDIVITLLNSNNSNLYYGLYTNINSECVNIAYDEDMALPYDNIGVGMSKTIRLNVSNSCSNNYAFNLYIVTDSNSLIDKKILDDDKKLIVNEALKKEEEVKDNNEVRDTTNDNDVVEEKLISHIESLGNEIIKKDQYGNFRYYGKDIDNYLKIDKDIYRIIGVIDSIDSDGVKSKRVKIIRENSLGKYDYDGENNFKIINSLDINKDLFDKVKYYVNELDNNYTRFDDYYDKEIDDKGNSYIDYFGVMYVSDYLYSLGSCDSDLYSDNQCYSYLSKDGYEDITMNKFKDTDNVFTINNNVLETNKNKGDVRVVGYLNKDLKLVSGSGKANNPYVVSK